MSEGKISPMRYQSGYSIGFHDGRNGLPSQEARFTGSSLTGYRDGVTDGKAAAERAKAQEAQHDRRP